jgi:Flp pilus assembly pilin Flp
VKGKIKMTVMKNSAGSLGSKPKKQKKSKAVEYGITFTVVAVCLVALYATVGVQASEDWTTLKANLDPDWTPNSTAVEGSSKVALARPNIGTAGGD